MLMMLRPTIDESIEGIALGNPAVGVFTFRFDTESSRGKSNEFGLLAVVSDEFGLLAVA